MMNDLWVAVSLLTRETIAMDNDEFWLDSVGLLETSWLLFAGLYRYKSEHYGYPGTGNDEM